MAPFFGGAYLAWWWLMWISAGTKYTAIDPFDWVDVIAKAAIAVLSIAAVVGTYLSSASTQRQRVKWAAIGISLGYVGIAGQEMLFRFGLFQGVLQFVTWCLVLAAFLAPLSVAYAIARHRVIDVRFVLTRGAGYLILSFVLAATLASTYWTTNSFLQQTHVAALIQLSFAILAGVILMRAYSWMDSGINRLFFSRHYTALQRLSSLSVGLSRAESLDELERLVASEPSIALDLVAGGVYRHTPNGWYVQISTQLRSTSGAASYRRSPNRPHANVRRTASVVWSPVRKNRQLAAGTVVSAGGPTLRRWLALQRRPLRRALRMDPTWIRRRSVQS